MIINKITNTNFKGLFTDKSAENGGNWKMVYNPYSWEEKMATKQQFNITDTFLPMNEEIYIKSGEKEISQDILGTTSYLKDKTNGNDILRRTITEENSMPLEDSLKVFNKKLNIFLKNKLDYMKELKDPIQQRMKLLFSISKEHDFYLKDLALGFFSGRQYNKDYDKTQVRNNFAKMTKIAEDTGHDFLTYAKVFESAEIIRNKIEKIKNELETIKSAKAEKLFIDISRRDIENADAPLKNALKKLETPKNFLIALPHRTVTLNEIIKATGGKFNAESVLKHVEKLITKKL